MAKFEHTQRLTNIKFTKTITAYCPLGKDYYTAEINVHFIPDKYLMDYLDEEEYFKSLSGKSYIIEDLVNEVVTHYAEEYEPDSVEVTVNAYNATHFPVQVTKTYYKSIFNTHL